MSDKVNYPSWDDCGVPKSILSAIKQLRVGSALDYLLLNRVFRFNVRAHYLYTCNKCGYHKKMFRHYEDYSTCERCGSNLISSIANWRMGKDKIEPYSKSDDLLIKLIQQMHSLYVRYFRKSPPQDFLQCGWHIEAIEVPKDSSAYGYSNLSSNQSSPSPVFMAKYSCGDQVKSKNQALAVCKASLLCPFLWDDGFDWKTDSHRNRGQKTHIIPLISIWSKLLTESSSKRSSSSSSLSPSLPAPRQSLDLRPIQFGDEHIEDLEEMGIIQPPPSNNDDLPAAVVRALQNHGHPPTVFRNVFNNFS